VRGSGSPPAKARFASGLASGRQALRIQVRKALPHACAHSRERRLVVETQAPLASRKHREALALSRVPTEHVSDSLSPGSPRRKTGSSAHFAEHAPLVRPKLPEDDVSPRIGHVGNLPLVG